MKQLFFLLTISLSFIHSLKAQKDSIFLKGNYGMIKTNIVRNLTKEYHLMYEWGLSDYKAIEVKAGYIYSKPKLSQLAESWLGSAHYFHQGISLGAGYKKYKNRNRVTSFWKHSFNYKYEFFNDKFLWRGGLSGSSSANNLHLSQRKHSMNLKTEWGFTTVKKAGGLFEMYMGLGINFIHVWSIYHDCRFCYGYPALIPESDKPYLDNGYYVLPTVHFGFRFGGLFLRNEK